MQSVNLKISGMSCQHCVATVTKALSATPGVSDAVVSLETNQATVNYEPNLVEPAKLAKVIEDAGYNVVD